MVSVNFLVIVLVCVCRLKTGNEEPLQLKSVCICTLLVCWSADVCVYIGECILVHVGKFV